MQVEISLPLTQGGPKLSGKMDEVAGDEQKERQVMTQSKMYMAKLRIVVDRPISTKLAEEAEQDRKRRKTDTIWTKRLETL